MISNNELLQIKERMVVAGEAARRIVESNDQRILYDEREYWRVHISLSSLQTDVAAVLSELDTLRAMFVERVNEFFGSGGLNDAVSSGSRDREDAGSSVAGVSEPADVGSSSESPADNAAVSGVVSAKRVSRRRKPRSIETGDSPSLPGTTAAVDGGAGEGEVCGGEAD